MKNSKRLLIWLTIGISLLVYGSMISVNGFPSLKALNILNVYTIRENVKYPLLMGYLVPWQAKVINPLLITTSVINKNRKALIVSILMQLLIYLLTAHKSFLLIPLAIVIVMHILKNKKFFRMSAFMAPIGVIFSYLFMVISGDIILPSFLIRRFLFVPAFLRFSYYDFFSKNEILYFSEGIIGKIVGINSPYNIKVANLIGYLYVGDVSTSANTGYLAEAYSNMGFFGMIIISMLLILVFLFIDSLSSKIDKEFVVGLSIFSIIGLNDGAFLTTMLTGGMGLLLILLYLYSFSDSYKNLEEI